MYEVEDLSRLEFCSCVSFKNAVLNYSLQHTTVSPNESGLAVTLLTIIRDLIGTNFCLSFFFFLLRMTDTMTSQNIDLSSWDTL
jgi:hypothetical protein